MIEYLINFFLASAGYFLAAIVFAILSLFATQSALAKFVDYQINKMFDSMENVTRDDSAVDPFESDEIRLTDIFSFIAVFFVLIGTYVGATSPSNTYKHEGVDIDRVVNEYQQAKENLAEEIPDIQDESLQSKHTIEGRQERFDDLVDYKKKEE